MRIYLLSEAPRGQVSLGWYRKDPVDVTAALARSKAAPFASASAGRAKKGSTMNSPSMSAAAAE
jgi:hypothetical protein